MKDESALEGREPSLADQARRHAAEALDRIGPIGAQYGAKTDAVKDWPPWDAKGPVTGGAVYLRSALDHCKAGRAHAGRLRDIYVFGDEPPATISDLSSDSFALNGSESHVDLFLEWLRGVTEARRQARKHPVASRLRDIEMSEGRCVLVGPRGCGKTILLNYIVSARAQELDDAKICWVRLNLSRLMHSSDVMKRLLYQQSYIIWRKYIVDATRFADGQEDFRKWLLVHPQKPNALALITRAQGLRAISPEIADPSPGAPMTGPESFAQPSELTSADASLLKQFMREKGYEFLYVFDGLDSAEPTSDLIALWQQWVEGCVSAWMDLGKSDCIMISMRPESYRQFHYKLFGHSSNQAAPRLFHMAPVDANAVFLRRMKFAAAQCKVPPNYDAAAVINGLSNCLVRLAAAGLESERLPDVIPERVSEKRTNLVRASWDVLPKLSGILRSDLRIMLRSLAVLLHRMLIDLSQEPQATQRAASATEAQRLATSTRYSAPEFTDSVSGWLSQMNLESLDSFSAEVVSEFHTFVLKQRHRAMEVLTNGSNLFHATPFIYSQSPMGELHIEYGDHFSRLAGVLPNLWTAPLGVVRANSEETTAPLGKLLFLNLLLAEADEEGGPQGLADIRETLQAWGVSRLFFDAMCHELSYMGLIELRRTDAAREVIELTEGGRFAIGTIATNHDYVFSVVESIVLPKSVRRQMKLTAGAPPRERVILRLWNALMFAQYVRKCWQVLRPKVSSQPVCISLDQTLDALDTALAHSCERIGRAENQRGGRESRLFEDVVLGALSTLE